MLRLPLTLQSPCLCLYSPKRPSLQEKQCWTQTPDLEAIQMFTVLKTDNSRWGEVTPIMAKAHRSSRYPRSSWDSYEWSKTLKTHPHCVKHSKTPEWQDHSQMGFIDQHVAQSDLDLGHFVTRNSIIRVCLPYHRMFGWIQGVPAEQIVTNIVLLMLWLHQYCRDIQSPGPHMHPGGKPCCLDQ